MTAIINLADRRSEPNLDAIRRLEQMLEMAKSADLVNIAIAYVERDGSGCSVWSVGPYASALIGSVAQLQFRLSRSLDDNAEIFP